MTKKELVEALEKINVYYECEGHVKRGKIDDYSINELLEIIKNLTTFRKIKSITHYIDLNESKHIAHFDDLSDKILDVKKEFILIKSSVAFCDISLKIERFADNRTFSYTDIIKIECLLHVNYF